MKNPIFVYCRDCHDILMFSNVEMAHGYLEPPDIRNDEFAIYDCEGIKLTASIFPEKQGFITRREWFRITSPDRQIDCSDELAIRLLVYLKALGLDQDIGECPTFSELVNYYIENRIGQFAWDDPQNPEQASSRDEALD